MRAIDLEDSLEATVLLVNAAMFMVDFMAGLVADSTALVADSIDMLGDASVYALTLYVLDRGLVWRSRAAFVKGTVMALFGIGVAVHAVVKALAGEPPKVEWMGGIGALALIANITCLILLYRHRADDLNMRSTWLCSRNDILANVGVLFAACGVYLFNTVWPDVLIGGLIAALFLRPALDDACMTRVRWASGRARA